MLQNTLRKNLILLVLILAGESIFFLPFVLVRIFRPVFLRVFELSNLELGACFSVYGVVAMVAYFFGGPLADRFSSRNLMSVALWATGLGGIYLSFLPDLWALRWLYGFWGLTTILLFWAAMIRATRDWGGAAHQGKAFGWLEGGRGLTAALLGTLALSIFSSESDATGVSVFQQVIRITSAVTLAVGGLVWFAVPSQAAESKEATPKASFSHVLDLVRRPTVWLQAGIIVCAYVGYKITDDLSLYAHEVLHFNEVKASAVGTAAIWMRPVFALFAGLLADRLSGGKVLSACFACTVFGGAGLALGIPGNLAWLALITMALALAGIYGLRGVYFAVMGEGKIPTYATGTAVGIMSVVGYTPDVFMSPLMGWILDSYPGPVGHQGVFGVLVVFGLLGLLLSLLFLRKTLK
ncbi:MAG: nitrate/nitrite transporter [Salibacteraceae bacterium]